MLGRAWTLITLFLLTLPALLTGSGAGPTDEVVGAGPTDRIYWCESFDDDVFEDEPVLGDPRWSRDGNEGIASGDGMLRIPAGSAHSSRAAANVAAAHAFTFESTQRLVSGGQNYLLPGTQLTFENGVLEVTYLLVDGNPNWGGWHFADWTFIEAGAPAGEGAWTDIQVHVFQGEANLSARPTGSEDWTFITSAPTDGLGHLERVVFAQPWWAVIEVDSVSVERWNPVPPIDLLDCA